MTTKDFEDAVVIQTTPDETVTVEKSKHSGIVRPILLVVLLSIMAAAAYHFWGGHQSTDTKTADTKKNRIAPVNVAIARIQNVPIEVRTIGNVLPYSVVNIVPQVGGQLQKVFFTQGQSVKKGDLLFQIDPRTLEAALEQALGNVARDQAQVSTARANLAKDEAQVGQLQANLNRDHSLARMARTQMARYAQLVTD